jgi:hypothetical protein
MILVRSSQFGDGKSCFLLFAKSIPNHTYNIAP